MARIRFAETSDTPVIVGFIRALAEYEKLADACVVDEATLRANLFGPKPYAEVLLIEEAGRAPPPSSSIPFPPSAKSRASISKPCSLPPPGAAGAMARRRSSR